MNLIFLGKKLLHGFRMIYNFKIAITNSHFAKCEAINSNPAFMDKDVNAVCM